MRSTRTVGIWFVLVVFTVAGTGRRSGSGDSVTAGMSDLDPCHSSPRTQEARMRHVGTLQSLGGLSTQEGVWGGAGGSVRLGRVRSKRLLLCGARTRDIGLSSRIAHKTHALTTELIGGFDHQVR